MKKQAQLMFFLFLFVSSAYSGLTISVDRAEEIIYAQEDDDVTLTTYATCDLDVCILVQVYPFYCAGETCKTFKQMGEKSSSEIYSKTGIPYKCKNIDSIGKCVAEWTLRPRKYGLYKIAFAAGSENTQSVQSKTVYLRVSGCGDGACEGSEGYTNCPEDCCEPDCTGVYDDACHRFCDGYNNCSLAGGCDGTSGGFAECVSENSYLSCCSEGTIRCEYGSYCSDASCLPCDGLCNGVCASAACFPKDPDCDRDGNATRPCCGNGVIDAGEECDGEKGSCGLSCTDACACVTTTSSTTSSTVSSTTSSSTSVPSIVTPSTTTIPATTSSTQAQQEIAPPLQIGEKEITYSIALAALIVLVVVLVRGKKSFDRKRKAGREKRITEKRLIEKAIELVKKDYAEGKISEKDAENRMLAYGEELAEVEKKL